MLAGLLLATASCGEQAAKQRLVLITLDTLRLDSLERRENGGAMPRTLDFTDRGQRFERFYSATATTQPSHASLFTGRHPWQHGVVRNGTVLAPEEDTVAEHLGRAGFETAAVVASFALHSRFGFDQGFDHYDDDFALTIETGQKAWMGKKIGGEFYSLAEDVTGRALAALDRFEGDRQFLWVHYYDPHTPYGDWTEEPLNLSDIRAAIRTDPTVQEVAIQRGRELYDLDVRKMDRAMERLLQRLEQESETYRTHVVLVSDHGESFGEANSLGHGNRLTPEQIHVPLAIVSPALGPGLRGDVTGGVDVFTTLLALVELKPTIPVAGRDLLTTREGIATGMRRLSVKPFREARADGSSYWIDGPRFYFARKDGLITGLFDELYVEDQDPPNRDLVFESEVREQFFASQAQLERLGVDTLEDEETTEGLRALGYVE